MTLALARSLLMADAVTPDALAQALLVSATRGTSLVRALLATRAIDPARLELELDRGEAPVMRHVAPVMSLVEHLPQGLCERLLALPVRRDPRTGTIDVAVVDARDPHPVEEMAHWLKAPVRMVRTSLVAMDTALRRIHARTPPDPAPRALAPPIWVPPPKDTRHEVAKTPAYGSPAVDGSRPMTPEDDEMATDVADFGTAGPNIPIPLTRRSLPSTEIDQVESTEDWSPPAAPAPRSRKPPPLPPSVAVPAPSTPAPAVVSPRRVSSPPELTARRASAPAPPAPKRTSVAPASGPRRASAPPAGPGRTRSSFPPVAPARTRSSVPPPSSDREPVLDLRRRKSGSPIAPGAPPLPFGDIGPALASLREATNRDAILEQVVVAVQTVARKVAVLAMRRNSIVGWTCSPEMAERATLRTARIAPALSAVLSGALDADEAILARIPKDASHAPMLATLRVPPAGEVALVSIKVEGKGIALVIADEMGDTLLATRRMEEIARAAGEALARLLREKRK